MKKIFFFINFFLCLNLLSQQNKIKNYTQEDGLPTNTIYDVYQDEIGYLWIATDKGAVKFDGNNFQQINKKETFSIYSNGRTNYFGLEKGLLILNGKNRKFFKSKKVIKIFNHNDDIFICSTEGVYLLMENYLQPIQISPKLDFAIIRDIIYYDDYFYISSNKGFWKLKNLKKPEEIELILDENIISALKFDDKIIVATQNKGLKVLKNDVVQKTIKSIPNISSIRKNYNELWISSFTDGIEILILPSISFKQKINKYNSIITNTINSIYIDKNNSKLITSDKGFYKIDNQLNATKKKPKPIVFFESFYVNYRNTDSLLLASTPILLSPTDNNISITYKTVDLIFPKKILYRYNLNNSYSDWSFNNQLQFANLNPGKYIVKIQSKVENEISDINNLQFTIQTPIYRQTIYILSFITLLLILSYISIDFYIKRIHKRNNIRINQLQKENHLLGLEQKALQLQMNPHFIFNVLNGIKALGNNGKIDDLNTAINKFSILLRSILNNSRKEEITLKEELESIKNYISLEQQMNTKSFDYSIEVLINNIDINEILVPSMLIQPFIENSIQHGFQLNKKGIVNIKVEIVKNFLDFTIIDNGIGINSSVKNKSTTNNNSLALKVTKERIQYLSPTNLFDIGETKKDLKVTGTRVYFKIPLKTDY